MSVACCSVMGATALQAAEPAVADVGPGRYAALILADQPAAYWRFNETQGSVVQNLSSATGLDGQAAKPVTFDRPGPNAPRFPAFHSANVAAHFSNQAKPIRVTDPGTKSVLDFDAGDAITLEAWVNPARLAEDQQVYVVGKGRTNNNGVARENQNYALRLRGVGGTARISFLFRNAKNRANQREDFHRWNSNVGFVPGGGWHHVAVTYRFGEPKSARGYLDGRPVSGTWDYGGATSDGPVVDNDELWIGSSMGGSKASTFAGDLDEIALYRRVLSPGEIAQRVWVRSQERQIADKDLPKDGALVEILEGIPDQKSWDFLSPPVTDSYVAPAWAFLEVPRKYSNRGVQIDRTNPFALRVMGHVTLPARECRLLLRARNGGRLFLDGQLILEAPFHNISGSAHGSIRDVAIIKNDTIRPLATGDNERLVTIQGDGKQHRLQLDLFLGGTKKRPELGETSVSIEGEDGIFRVLSPRPECRFPVTDEGALAFQEHSFAFHAQLNAERRKIAGAEETKFWNHRHQLAKTVIKQRPPINVPPAVEPSAVLNDVDRFINHHLQQKGKSPAKLIDDWTFLRRVTLDLVGTVPTPAQIEGFMNDQPEGRRARYVERLLADDGWADHWVGYWQDVLAENPNVVNPTLNNTGPFRWWIHESFLDNKPFDRFVTELIRMEGSAYYGGPGGFAMATQNDAPMAAKAHVIGQAFLGLEMKCARCHDAPFHDFQQSDLFHVAAMLKRSPQEVPKTSSVPSGQLSESELITVTLKPGEQITPEWPFGELVKTEALDAVVRNQKDSREQLAALVTSPHNARFAQVIVNRLWKRYLGFGLLEPVDDWERGTPSHPELLDYLSRELVGSGFDLKHVTRLILNSHTYQRIAQESAGNVDDDSLFVGPLRRRMTAEQIVDSLFTACGKDFHAGELNIDADGSRAYTTSLNLGRPRRAWHFTSMSNERDRPSLALPLAQGFLDVLQPFGWRASRQDPLTTRDQSPTVLQPAILANGTLGRRFTRCSEDSAFTQLALQDLPLEALIEYVFQRTFCRKPTPSERETFTELLADGYNDRICEVSPEQLKYRRPRNPGVSWSNHLSEASNRAKIELQEVVRKGDPPSPRLHPDWRERYEDLLWALLNSPEFVFVP